MDEGTHFASAKRTPADKILKEYELVGSEKFFIEIFGAITGIGAVIDQNRQIVYAKKKFPYAIWYQYIRDNSGQKAGGGRIVYTFS
jgi:hypothetical protein